jgi:hypothetical protein
MDTYGTSDPRSFSGEGFQIFEQRMFPDKIAMEPTGIDSLQ